jgi:hypothetical protein
LSATETPHESWHRHPQPRAQPAHRGRGALATIVTNAVYVEFTAAIATRQTAARRELERAVVSAVRFAVINYTQSCLCGVRRARLLARRFFVGDLAQSQDAVVAPLQPGSP